MAEGIRFRITGHPVAKQRARVFVQGGRAIATTPPKSRKWEDDARMVAWVAMGERKPFAGCLGLVANVCLAAPPSWTKWKRKAAYAGLIAPAGGSDIDNYVKAVLDSMNGIVFLDDSQVIHLEASKRYDAAPCVEVAVTFRKPLPAGNVRKKDLEAL